MKIIEICNLNKIYNSSSVPVQALKDINVEISQGEFLVIVGPSGSGKTTLLNIIGGIDKPTSGQVIISGVDITGLSSHDIISFRLNNIGFVFQSYNLIPVLTAAENIEFVMQLQGKRKPERELRTNELLEAIGLADRKNDRPSRLSGGQQQRIAVARALASKPKFILADEPTANLDSKSAENLLNIMEKLNVEENITFIFSTHDARVVARARRVITLSDGEIESDIFRAL